MNAVASETSSRLLSPSPAPNIADQPMTHIVQAGETLSLIAQRYGVSLSALVEANSISNPNIIRVGQRLTLPRLADQASPSQILIPDNRLVRGPGSAAFNVEAFIRQQTGIISQMTDMVTTRIANGAGFDEQLSAAQIVDRVATEYSVDARLLLAILELRTRWLSSAGYPSVDAAFPLISEQASVGIDRKGLYRQLAWLANALNRGYYGHKYRNLRQVELANGVRYRLTEGLNAGSVAVQFALSLAQDESAWLAEIEAFATIYAQLFGDPFEAAVDPLIPPNLQPPILTLPFASGETWYFTGGPHGGWGSGSAWSSLDFAPPDERTADMPRCYTSQYFVRAAAAGLVVRSKAGAVVIDLDEDGDEGTGWTLNYLHIAETDRVAVGNRVQTGDPIGRASCEGGFSTATHFHFGRRYNGEWIPSDCSACPAGSPPSLVMSGWRAVGLAGQEYQGSLIRDDGSTVIADQGRDSEVNRISW
ncbi:MAG: LysM peptidoglycan-binding domain-containing protein [Anaerolineae bacterium]|nr:LysM peptidoglycan-binding domain-containing protein [Anaerolineae bacterium]